MAKVKYTRRRNQKRNKSRRIRKTRKTRKNRGGGSGENLPPPPLTPSRQQTLTPSRQQTLTPSRQQTLTPSRQQTLTPRDEPPPFPIYTPAPPLPPTSPPNEKKKTIYMLEQAQSLLDDPNITIRFPTQLKAAVKKQNSQDIVFDSEKMVKGLGNKGFMDLLFDDNEGSNFRKITEKLSASKQCQAVLGACSDPCICWLCGTPINKSTETPECEHILPISRTILFSGLKSTKKIEKHNTNYGQAPSDNIETYHKLSYDYAHKACNREKSDMVLIKWDETTKQIIFDEVQARALAEKIESLKRVDVNTLVDKYREKINALIAPVNTEIKSILSLDGATMDLYWAYTLNIMKYYVLYEYLLENGKIGKSDKQEQTNYIEHYLANNTLDYTPNDALEEAKTDVSNYKKNLHGIKKNWKTMFGPGLDKRKSLDPDPAPPLKRSKPDSTLLRSESMYGGVRDRRRTYS